MKRRQGDVGQDDARELAGGICLSPQQTPSAELAGEKIKKILAQASGNGAPIGGLKVVMESGWFAARPSGIEDIYKIYAKSFHGVDYLRRILEGAQAMVEDALAV